MDKLSREFNIFYGRVYNINMYVYIELDDLKYTYS